MQQQNRLEAAQEKRRSDIETNRALGVVEYQSPKQKQADAVYEVIEGYKTLPGGIRLGPGQRFRPTEKQIADGSLKNKARELSATEYAGIQRMERKPQVTGADIGVRALPMSPGAIEMAVAAGLTETDFAGLEPAFNNMFTKAQVQDLIDAKNPPAPEPEGVEDGDGE